MAGRVALNASLVRNEDKLDPCEVKRSAGT